MIFRYLRAKTQYIQYYLYIGLFLLITIPAAASEANVKITNLTVTTSDQAEINIEVYRSRGDKMLLWHPHERGIQDSDKQLARRLAENGIEVWITDLLESYFLPNTASNMDKLPATGFAALLSLANRHGKKIIVAASGRAAIPALRGIRQWQLENRGNTNLLGAILVSPKLFIETPDPGLAGTFMPIVKSTNLPIVLIQPDKSPWFWKLKESVAALQVGGSDVFIRPIVGVRDRFYFRPDAFDNEKKVTKTFHQQLIQASSLLRVLPQKNRTAAKLEPQESTKKQNTKKERKLKTYQGRPKTPPLALPYLNGKQFDLTSLKGKVVLVNFWATWCPPCVHEMPSMQRLAEHFKQQAFTIIGVNMAEDKSVVKRFLKSKVTVSFPIVMDKDGQALKSWKVFAFPTSYVIDKKGNIRYALFGGIEWDTPDVKNKINKLLQEQGIK